MTRIQPRPSIAIFDQVMLRSTPGPAEEVLGFFRWFFGVVLALGVGVVFCSLLVVSQAVFSAIFPADFAPELASSTMTMAGEVAFMSSEGCCFLAASWLGSSMLGVSASFLFSFLRPAWGTNWIRFKRFPTSLREFTF